MVSVVVPVFNAGEYLKPTLDALLAQTLQDIEIITVNDGSTDSSGALLDSYARLHPQRFLVIHTQNRGAWKARLTGIKVARSDYVGFCDSDDLPKPQMFAKLLQRAQQDDADMVICAYQRFKDAGDSVLAIEMARFGDQTLNVKADPGILLAINTANWNKLFKASLFTDLLDFETASREAQDTLLHMMTCLRCNRIAFIQESLYHYRVHRGSLIGKSNLHDIEVLADNMGDIRADLVDKGIEETYLEICDIMALTHVGLSLPFRQDPNQESTFSGIMKRVRTILDEQFPLYLNASFTSSSYSRANAGLNTLLRCAQWAYRLRLASPALRVLRFARRRLGYEVSW